MEEYKNRERICYKCGDKITMSENYFKLKNFDHCVEIDIKYFHGDCVRWL